jgi:hypothetical protein
VASWPKQFHPATHGYTVVRPDPFIHQRRVLGIRIDKFDLKQKQWAAEHDGPIGVSLLNAGGGINGPVMGACRVYYAPKRVGNRWMVELIGWVSF